MKKTAAMILALVQGNHRDLRRGEISVDQYQYQLQQQQQAHRLRRAVGPSVQRISLPRMHKVPPARAGR